MILSLQNIGKVESAVIELNGITVIAGENNTGKSTVGKVLYSIFNSFYQVEEKIQHEREELIKSHIDYLYIATSDRVRMQVETVEIARMIIGNAPKYIDNPELLRADVIEAIGQNDLEFEKLVSKDDWTEQFQRIEEVCKISDEAIFGLVLSKKLDGEFNGQVNNIFTDSLGTITLKIKNDEVAIEIKDNFVKSISKQFRLNTEVLYLDDPLVMDAQRAFLSNRPGGPTNHREHLKLKLFRRGDDGKIIKQLIATNRLDTIYAKINPICGGEIVSGKRSGTGYQRANSDKVLDVRNISTGLKTFVILKILLQNGSLEENGTVVLDEPEIHLHPEWQLLFAELIVLLQKEFHMHILINTHSPYFLNAIEVYAAKHQIADRCKYYMASLNGDVAKIEDVSDRVDLIYQRLARPLQELENVRWRDDD